MIEILFGIGFWVACCILLGKYAEKRGRNFWTWFLIPLLFSPILGAIILLIKGPAEGTVKQCPLCKEEIKADALKCKHCGSMLENPEGRQQEEPVSSFSAQEVSVVNRDKIKDQKQEGIAFSSSKHTSKIILLSTIIIVSLIAGYWFFVLKSKNASFVPINKGSVPVNKRTIVGSYSGHAPIPDEDTKISFQVTQIGLDDQQTYAVKIFMGRPQTLESSKRMRQFLSANGASESVIREAERSPYSCGGRFEGVGKMQGNTLQLTLPSGTKKDEGDNCIITLMFSEDGTVAEMTEVKCMNWHGVECEFRGHLTKQTDIATAQYAAQEVNQTLRHHSQVTSSGHYEDYGEFKIWDKPVHQESPFITFKAKFSDHPLLEGYVVINCKTKEIVILNNEGTIAPAYGNETNVAKPDTYPYKLIQTYCQ